MTRAKAIKEFKATLREANLGFMNRDKPAFRQAWNDFTYYLCKSGKITEKQYSTWLGPKN